MSRPEAPRGAFRVSMSVASNRQCRAFSRLFVPALLVSSLPPFRSPEEELAFSLALTALWAGAHFDRERHAAAVHSGGSDASRSPDREWGKKLAAAAQPPRRHFRTEEACAHVGTGVDVMAVVEKFLSMRAPRTRWPSWTTLARSVWLPSPWSLSVPLSLPRGARGGLCPREHRGRCCDAGRESSVDEPATNSTDELDEADIMVPAKRALLQSGYAAPVARAHVGTDSDLDSHQESDSTRLELYGSAQLCCVTT